jgi:HK97 family phage prohead protease
MEFKNFPFEYKADSAGTFSGMASVYGNVDLGGDVVLPGAFADSLKANGGAVPVLWQHRQDEPIGKGLLEDTPASLNILGELDMDDPMAHKAHGKLLKGIVRGLSIGYSTLEDFVKDGVRYIQKADLWEVSVVTFPMNPLATVTAAKNMTALSDFEALLRGVVEEIKAGRKISAANMNMLQRANECAKECSVHIEEMMRMASGEDEDEKSAEQLTELKNEILAAIAG